MQHCPLEIWTQILAHFGLGTELDKEALKASALTLKALTPVAQKLLFRAVELRTVTQMERLLEIFKQNHSLALYVRRVGIYNYGGKLWLWFSSHDGLDLLSHISRVPHLTLRGIEDPQFDIKMVQGVLNHLTAVQHLAIEGRLSEDFEDVCSVLHCFRATLEHLELESIGGFDIDCDIEVGEPPEALPTLSDINHYSSAAFPRLKGFTSNGCTPRDLTGWLLRSEIANQIQTLTIIPQFSTDIQHAAMLLLHGGRALKEIVFEMIDEGWEGSSGMMIFGIY